MNFVTELGNLPPKGLTVGSAQNEIYIVMRAADTSAKRINTPTTEKPHPDFRGFTGVHDLLDQR
jgi:hypothetical protein